MSNRKCRLFLEIENGQVKRYGLTPLAGEEIGPQFVAGFRAVNHSETPSPVYLVRVTLSGAVVCNCPAFLWDVRKGEKPNAPPDQPAPTCKHCEALRAAGVLPVHFVEMIAERTKLLDAAEQSLANRDLEREAACRNADSLRSEIAALKMEVAALRLARPATVEPVRRRGRRKAVAA
ncbi:MAG: hypothetical protein ACRELF_11310 [Gemmataceae bacterium]